MTTTVSAVAAQRAETLPSVADVFVHAAAQIHQAAAVLWPGVPVQLDRHVPSVTGYVHRARIGEQILYAKASLLGVSLVSLLRGACGPWPTVLVRQRDYVEMSDGLLAREAAQLRALAALHRPRVCAVAGLAKGVIFTEPATGPSLGSLLLALPGATAELLSVTFNELRPLHQAGAARRLHQAGAISERSIAGTFQRKFNGLSRAAYIERVGVDRCDPPTCSELALLVHRSVDRLRHLRMALPDAVGTSLAYGDLKPEHVIFPDGQNGRPILLDPGLMRAAPMVDVAKLLSRTILLLIAQQPGHSAACRVIEGFSSFVASRVAHLSGWQRSQHLRHTITLWLMDSLNILTTYLSAPAALPLPPLGLALVERAAPICRLIDAVSADLVGEPDRRDAWDGALARAVEVTS